MEFDPVVHGALQAGAAQAGAPSEALVKPHDDAAACRRALETLTGFSHGLRRQERFLAAHADGSCYLCHAPLRAFLRSFPCPHWFIASASTVERVAPVFQTYVLADVLHFLLSTLQAESGGTRGSQRLAVCDDAAGRGIRLRIDRKWWSFQAAADGDGATLLLGLLNTRTGKHSSLRAGMTDEDAQVLDAIAGAIGAAG